jgi:hypothetical protein
MTKLSIEIIIGGGDTLREKFLSEIEKNPQLSQELVNYFGQGVMWALHLRREDKITIEGFVVKEVKPEDKEEEKK